MGALGLPGDFSSQSRFVRAVFTKMNSISGDSDEASVSQFFHILGSVQQPRGCCEISKNETVEDETVEDETVKDETVKDETVKDETAKGRTAQYEVGTQEVAEGQANEEKTNEKKIDKKKATGRKYEITIYTSCCNADRGIYYYTTYDNHQITAVDMHRENLNSSCLIRYPLICEEQIKLQNA